MADKNSSTDAFPRRITRRSVAIAEVKESPSKILKTLQASENDKKGTEIAGKVENKNGDATESIIDSKIDSNTYEMINEISDLLESGNGEIKETPYKITEGMESVEITVESTVETNIADVNDKSIADNISKDDKVSTEIFDAEDVPNETCAIEKVDTPNEITADKKSVESTGETNLADVNDKSIADNISKDDKVPTDIFDAEDVPNETCAIEKVDTPNEITADKKSVESTGETNIAGVNDKSIADNISKDDKVPTEIFDAEDVPNETCAIEKVDTPNEITADKKSVESTDETNIAGVNDKSIADNISKDDKVPTEISKADTVPNETSDVEPEPNKELSDTQPAHVLNIVPELEEESLIKNEMSGVGSTSKTKIKLNIIAKDDEDIIEVPVIKPRIDVIDVPDDDTEVVSEDELPPPPTKEKVDGAEEVSDEELPAAPKPDAPPEGAEEVSDEELPAAPKPELPPEAEDVSDDELFEPLEKKKKIEIKKEPESGTIKTSEENSNKPESDKKTTSKESSGKRPREENDSSDQGVTKRPRDKSPDKKPKKLPELEKYWKTVKDNPADFTGWTYLLQYVDQESNVEAAEEAYNAFLALYPYCYGYWRKYADYEKKKGTKAKCEEVFDRGLRAIPLSVDLWIHYLNYTKATYSTDPDFIRTQFQRCVDTCGLEFRSDRLWDSYIKWEISQKELVKAREVFDRVLKIPLQGHTTHFESFQSFVASHSPKDILSVDEFLSLRQEVLPSLKKSKDSPLLEADVVVPPGEDGPPGEEGSTTVLDLDEANAIKEKIVATRRKIHKDNGKGVAERWSFEEGIKRPYFHVKALEKCQLKNWKDYLDYEISQADQHRIEVLFERCLIACALYEEFWHKFICYLQDQPSPNVDKIRDVFSRSCNVHHPKKINMHFEWTAFEETQGNPDKAAEILEKIEKEHPKLIEIPLRRIALAKRLNQREKVATLYDRYLEAWKTSKDTQRHYFDLAVKYARYCTIILKDVDKAVEVLKGAIETEKSVRSMQDYTRLYFQLVDVLLHRPQVRVEEIVSHLDSMLTERSSLNAQQKFYIVSRKLELLEEFGDDINLINNKVKELRELSDQVKKLQEIQKPPLPPPQSKEKKDVPTQIISSTRKPAAVETLPSANPPNLPPAPPPPTPFFPGPQQGFNQFPNQGQAPYQPVPPPNFGLPPFGVDPNNPVMYQGWYGGPNYGPGQQWAPYPGNYPGMPPPNQRF